MGESAQPPQKKAKKCSRESRDEKPLPSEEALFALYGDKDKAYRVLQFLKLKDLTVPNEGIIRVVDYGADLAMGYLYLSEFCDMLDKMDLKDWYNGLWRDLDYLLDVLNKHRFGGNYFDQLTSKLQTTHSHYEGIDVSSHKDRVQDVRSRVYLRLYDILKEKGEAYVQAHKSFKAMVADTDKVSDCV
ncbi:hypothetical protein A2U01_0043226 [Trifolium medium]|uniref:Uncharacterized protein n=1 Tax=Trifolium medium TaxID=97028 RepID=A0A392QCJ9_9FABA|nr:hypothetical protein [Trifolium medium]